jgi:hypothetical protein
MMGAAVSKMRRIMIIQTTLKTLEKLMTISNRFKKRSTKRS